MSFITERIVSPDRGATATWAQITIDGNNAPDSEHFTCSDGKKATPLSCARQDRSGFKWTGRVFHEVVIKKMHVLDEDDLACLCWFIDQEGIRIIMTESYIVPQLNELLADSFKASVKRGIKVAEGSSITFSGGGGYSGMSNDPLMASVYASRLGFKVSFR